MGRWDVHGMIPEDVVVLTERCIVLTAAMRRTGNRRRKLTVMAVVRVTRGVLRLRVLPRLLELGFHERTHLETTALPVAPDEVFVLKDLDTFRALVALAESPPDQRRERAEKGTKAASEHHVSSMMFLPVIHLTGTASE